MAKTLSPLSLAVLALLKEQPRHAYDMFATLRARERDRGLKVSPGSLYHSVYRLAEQELIEEEGTERDGNRPERTVYRLTDSGRETLVHDIEVMLGEPRTASGTFAFGLAEAHNIDRESLLRQLRLRLAELSARREDVRARALKASDRGIGRILWIDLPYQEHLLAAEISWLQGLLDEIEDGRLDFNDFGQASLERTRNGTD